MYGFQVPRNYNEALLLDKQNGNTKWQDCTALEMQQLKNIKPSLTRDCIHRPAFQKASRKIKFI